MTMVIGVGCEILRSSAHRKLSLICNCGRVCRFRTGLPPALFANGHHLSTDNKIRSIYAPSACLISDGVTLYHTSQPVPDTAK